MTSTRIVKEVRTSEYQELINKYREHIIVNPHANKRLDEAQRKVYKDEYLISILTEEHPELVGIQENERYAAFFKRKEGYLRIMFNLNYPKNIEIVTFYIVDHLPKV